MKCYSSATRLAIAVVAVLGLTAPAAAEEQVPFKGNLEGNVTITPVPESPPTIVDVHVEGAGNATQLGRFTLTIPHRVDRATRTASGSYHFTAANGDTLSANFTGQSMPTETLGVISIVETATITGGTGRFAGATGSFTSERLFDTFIGTTTGSFSGTISSPGAGNR
jgi:hypothetical protein